MKRIPDAEIDWLGIEARYRAGASARELSREHDIPHTRILRRAERFAWMQDPAGLKRERVKASLLGDPTTAKADSLIDAAAAEDVEDMNRGLRNARKILQRIEEHLDQGHLIAVDDQGREHYAAPSAKDLRTLGAANLASIETIRRVRNLDDPGQGASIYTKEERDAVVQAALGP